jgi:hypothetical protein
MYYKHNHSKDFQIVEEVFPGGKLILNSRFCLLLQILQNNSQKCLLLPRLSFVPWCWMMRPLASLVTCSSCQHILILIGIAIYPELQSMIKGTIKSPAICCWFFALPFSVVQSMNPWKLTRQPLLLINVWLGFHAWHHGNHLSNALRPVLPTWTYSYNGSGPTAPNCTQPDPGSPSSSWMIPPWSAPSRFEFFRPQWQMRQQTNQVGSRQVDSQQKKLRIDL